MLMQEIHTLNEESKNQNKIAQPLKQKLKRLESQLYRQKRTIQITVIQHYSKMKIYLMKMI